MAVEHDQQLAGYRRIRTKSQRPPKACNGLVQTACLQQDMSQTIERIEAVWFKCQRLSQRSLGFRVPSRGRQDDPEIGVRRCTPRRQAYRALQQFNTGRVISHLVANEPEHLNRVERLRVSGQNRSVSVGGFAQPALAVVQNGAGIGVLERVHATAKAGRGDLPGDVVPALAVRNSLGRRSRLILT